MLIASYSFSSCLEQNIWIVNPSEKCVLLNFPTTMFFGWNGNNLLGCVDLVVVMRIDSMLVVPYSLFAGLWPKIHYTGLSSFVHLLRTSANLSVFFFFF